MEIRELNESELEEALNLVWEVFSEYEVPEYSEEGINEFWSFIHNQDELDNLYIYGAFNKDEVVGVIATRKEHISLFFVKEEYQRRGIGKSLFEYIIDKVEEDNITVNSSPYGVGIYEKLGFKAIDKEQLVNGIRYIPMIYKIK